MRHRKVWSVLAAVALIASGFLAASAEAALTRITVVGAGKGAGAYRMASGLAEAVNRSSNWLNVTNQEIGGMVAGTRIGATGRSEIALTNGIFADQIQRKAGAFAKDPKPLKTLRGVGPVATSWFQMAVRADGNIKSYMDLADKRVNMGPRGSNTLYMTKFITDALGITEKVQANYQGWTDAANNLIDRKLDAFGIPNPVPSPSILQASRGTAIHILDVPDSVLQKFLKLSKGYSIDNKDMSIYKGMEGKKVRTISYTIYVVANKNVSPKIVYEVTKQTYDPKNRDFLINVYKGWKVGLDSAAKSGKFIQDMKAFDMKLHPGAARFWKEKGYKVD